MGGPGAQVGMFQGLGFRVSGFPLILRGVLESLVRTVCRRGEDPRGVIWVFRDYVRYM